MRRGDRRLWLKWFILVACFSSTLLESAPRCSSDEPIRFQRPLDDPQIITISELDSPAGHKEELLSTVTEPDIVRLFMSELRNAQAARVRVFMDTFSPTYVVRLIAGDKTILNEFIRRGDSLPNFRLSMTGVSTNALPNGYGLTVSREFISELIAAGLREELGVP